MKYLIPLLLLAALSCNNSLTYTQTLNQYTLPIQNKKQIITYKNINSPSRNLTVIRTIVESKNDTIISQLRESKVVKYDSTNFTLDNQIDPIDFYNFIDGKASKIELSVLDETNKAISTQMVLNNGSQVTSGKGVSFIKKDTTFHWKGKSYDAVLVHSFSADPSENINLNKIDFRRAKVNAYNIYAKELGLVKYGTKGVDEWEIESIK